MLLLAFLSGADFMKMAKLSNLSFFFDRKSIYYLFQVVYVAKRNIQKGDQVTDCYGIHHLYMSFEDRQTALLKGYSFQCDCSACTHNYGMLAQLPAMVAPNVAVKLGNAMSK